MNCSSRECSLEFISARNVGDRDKSVGYTGADIGSNNNGNCALESDSIPATSATVIEVVVEELWTRLVARMPMSKPMNGLEVVVSNCSAKPPPNDLNDALIKEMLTKNK